MSSNVFSDNIVVLHVARRTTARRRASLVAVLVFLAAAAGVAALYALAGQHLLAIWAGGALFGWMFVAGAAKASSE